MCGRHKNSWPHRYSPTWGAPQATSSKLGPAEGGENLGKQLLEVKRVSVSAIWHEFLAFPACMSMWEVFLLHSVESKIAMRHYCSLARFKTLFLLFKDCICISFWLAVLATGLGHTSAGHVHKYMDQVGCVLIQVMVSQGWLTWIPGSRHSCYALKPASLEPQEDCLPQALTIFRGARFIDWHLRCSFLGECWWAQGIFGTSGCVWVKILCLVPTVKKTLCQTCVYVGCLTNTNRSKR